MITRSAQTQSTGTRSFSCRTAHWNARDPFESDPDEPTFRRLSCGRGAGRPDREGPHILLRRRSSRKSDRGQSSSDIDPRAALAINALLGLGADPRSWRRGRSPRDFFRISRAETEAAGKLNHQLTKNTSLMAAVCILRTIAKPAMRLTPAGWRTRAPAAAHLHAIPRFRARLRPCTARRRSETCECRRPRRTRYCAATM